MAKAKPVNKLDHILRYLRAHGITMRQIAEDLKLEYDYIKNQKSQKDPEKQSKSLVEMVTTRYAADLKDMPPYIKTYGVEESANQEWKEDEGKYDKPSNEEKGNNASQLLLDIRSSLKVIRENQKKSFAYQQSSTKQIVKRLANGNVQLAKEIIEEIERDADSYNTDTDKQDPNPPEEPAP